MTTTTPTTYTKLRNGSWGLRGHDLAAGAQVVVSKRDGSTKTEVVGRILWTGQGITLATISQAAARGGYEKVYRSHRTAWEDRCPCSGGACHCGSDAPCCMCD